ncbi:MAG: hypothetical protein KJ676_05095 [Alphaproteobacteria bacterium]|nr:hypothetical protein [Alphaproteobacteria bacterium]MBU1525954.1 hypothetical protein [Alphaproteobacteria bacterium]MBU2116527.1 hypothetical protein [Alphaproteobacteria bacterium]MBU2351597.1 hypothetical protein [Alphaproteobacteria bacterium]MBU2383819.1 hypothetical protein [Alphaproteobacteria bacterium]
MTDFTPEFGSPPAGYGGIDDPLFLGVEPMVAGLFVLLLLGVAALAWLMGRRTGAAEGPAEAPKEIHKRILKSAQAALSAPSDRLHEKAKALRALIEELLGPVIVVANGMGARVKALDEALKGEVKEEAKPAPPGATKTEATSAAVAPVTVNTVTVISPAPPAPPAADKPKTRKLSHDEQVEAIAKAVRAFHDHWSQGGTRVDELKAARAALSRMPPREADHGGHDGGHDDHHDGPKRVWDR